MNLLVVTKHFWPERFLISDVVSELSKKHKITVVCGTPNYFYNGSTINVYDLCEKFPNIEFIQVKVTNRKKGIVNLILNYLSFSFNCKKVLKNISNKFDAIYTYQLSPVSIAKPAIWYGKKNNLPVFLYCLDLWPESAKAKIGKFKLIYKLIRKYSKNIYDSCTRIGITSKPFFNYFYDEFNIDRTRLVYLPQHAIDDVDDEIKRCEPDVHDGTTHFLYAGNLGSGQRIDVLINAFSLMKNKDAIFDVVGTGSCETKYISLVKKLQLEKRIIFHGQKDKKDISQFYLKADALLLALRGDNKVGDTLPGKLQTYLMYRKPIFASANGATKDIINEAKCGVCVPADSPEELALYLDDFIINRKKYIDCGKNGRQFFLQNFTIEKHINVLEKELINMVTCYDKKNN